MYNNTIQRKNKTLWVKNPTGRILYTDKKKNIFETVMGDNEGKGDVMEEILNLISKS